MIFGAHTQNSTALLVWMILGGIEAAVYIIYAILLIFHLVNFGAYVGQFGAGISDGHLAVVVAAIIIYVILAGVIIWTIVIAKRAREEIHNPNRNVNKA